MGRARWAIGLAVTLILGLAIAPPVQGATITKLASNVHPIPGDRVTYTLIVHGTRDGQVTVTDKLPFGVVYAGSLSPPDATYDSGTVTWQGYMQVEEIVEISFDVIVGDWETPGPLPIINKACVDDGTEVCSSVAIFLKWRRLHIPFLPHFYPPGPGARP